ncbi:hypothetical protein DKX38_022046 [Salix brachista]|uniref:protein-serine/threonine phosphatase n=1 Tax=Salix brachista TaxID=2182728 RepID=A0A5N5KAR5_9ROSI|nr:hypothetical protein DKX38_022046 [Salix brachista]
MLKRNSGVKLAPQRWQDNAADGSFTVVLTFEEKVFDMVLEGYGENSYGYKLFNPVTKKMIMSRDVRFDEEQEWNWSSENQLQKLIVDEEQIQKDEGEIMIAPSPSTSSPSSSPSSTRKTREHTGDL